MGATDAGKPPVTRVEILSGQAVQVGDRNTQYNQFNYIEPPMPAARRFVAGEIPQPPPAFQPRTALLATLRKRRPYGVIVVHVLTGMRGAGKTQAAAAYARLRATQKWRLVAWINGENPAAALDGLVEAAAVAGIGEPDADQPAIARAFRHWLEEDGKRCLIVFDNAVSPDSLRPYLPAVGGAHIIITSTNQSMSSLGSIVPVDVFTPAEARNYLTQRTAIPDTDNTIQLAEELGRLPLALAQAAAVITSQHLTYPAYLTRLRALPVSTYLARTDQDPYLHAIAGAIMLSLQAAYEGDVTGLAPPIMGLIALLSPAGVPRTLLHAAAANGLVRIPDEPRGVHGDPPGGGASEAEVDAVLGHLAGASLLAFSTDGAMVTAHRLIARIIREQQERDGILAATGTAAIALLQQATHEVEPVWQHVKPAKDLIQQIVAIDDHLAANSLPALMVPDLLKLRRWMVWCLNELGDNPGLAISYGEPLVAIYERFLGDGNRHTQSSMNDLARAYSQGGRQAEAISLGKRVLAARERDLGHDHPSTLAARGTLATTYLQAEKADETIGLLEPTLAALEHTFGEDDSNVLALRTNLALAYQQAGRVNEAIVLHERTLADLERLFEDNDPATSTVRNNLALAYKAAGRSAEAILLFERTFETTARVLGDNHPETLTSGSNLADAYLQVNRLKEAILLYKSILADRKKILGADHPASLVSRLDLAIAQRRAGQLAESISSFERALNDCERVLGEEDPNTINACLGLALTLQEAERADEAIPLLERTVAAEERDLGDGHPDTFFSRNRLALAYQETGQPNEAIPLFERTLADSRRVFGDDQSDTLDAQDNLAEAYRKAGRLDEAISLYVNTIADREQALGGHHMSTADSRNGLAFTYLDAGKANEAIPLLERTVSDRQRILGGDHPTTLTARGTLAAAYLQVGLTSEAILLYKGTLTDLKRVFGNDHPYTRSVSEVVTTLRQHKDRRPDSPPG